MSELAHHGKHAQCAECETWLCQPCRHDVHELCSAEPCCCDCWEVPA